VADPSADRIIGLYSDRAQDWIADRGPKLVGCDRPRPVEAPLTEFDWFARFMAAVPPGGTVLDVGSGSGWPVAATLIGRGFRVTGVEPSPGLRAHAERTLPDGEWLSGDMRTLNLAGRRFDGILAWYSLFHLTPEDQRIALPRLLSHAAHRGVFMTSSGPAEGEIVGDWRGEPLYHGSLDPDEYRTIFAAHGFVPDPVDPAEQDGHGVVWLARRPAA
jgi:SAM-dependent methyltransferase